MLTGRRAARHAQPTVCVRHASNLRRRLLSLLRLRPRPANQGPRRSGPRSSNSSNDSNRGISSNSRSSRISRSSGAGTVTSHRSTSMQAALRVSVAVRGHRALTLPPTLRLAAMMPAQMLAWDAALPAVLRPP